MISVQNQMKHIQYHFDFIAAFISIPIISAKAKWMQNGITILRGNGVNQLNCPHSVCIDDDQNIYVADSMNNRIVQWKNDVTIGQVVTGGQGKGNQRDQLSYPANVIVDKKE